MDGSLFDLLGSVCRRSYCATHHGAPLMLKELVLLFLIVFAGTGGELCVTRAMKKIGEVKDFRPVALVRTIIRVLGVGWMWLGVALYAGGFFLPFRKGWLENMSVCC